VGTCSGSQDIHLVFHAVFMRVSLLPFPSVMHHDLTSLSLPSGGIGAFGPLIIQGFGFEQFHTILFNIPFSAMQVVVTLLSAFISTKYKLKWPVVFALCFPPIGGAVCHSSPCLLCPIANNVCSRLCMSSDESHH